MFQSRLLKKAKKGDDKAFSKLIEQEKIKLFKMALLYMKNEDDALDVVQETVMKAFIHINTLKEEKYFSTWVTRILINTALETIRKKQNIVPINNQIIETEITNQHEERIDLAGAIRQLDEKYKTVILLRYYKDLTVPEIAELLECPQGTVKSNLHRGMIELKKLLTKGGVKYGEGN
ncbi:MAG: sigma-70 family RNA polymerase sigma factor [Lysinibacillus sp.]|nr:sigma-70 family RNA polymerase sigma factor [Lysinibacillus sp.]